MTREELISKGWKPELCRIGTLYFKDDFFCRFDFKEDDVVLVFSIDNDTHPLGKAKTYNDIIALQKESDEKYILGLEKVLHKLKQRFNEKYKQP